MLKNLQHRLKKVIDNQPRFSKLLGLNIIDAKENQVFAEMEITEHFTNRNGVMHGGAIMAFADDIAGATTFINLPKGMSTTTIESKTNFFRPVKIGERITAKCHIVNKGEKIFVLQTTISRSDKKIAAITIQTQMILKFRNP